MRFREFASRRGTGCREWFVSRFYSFASGEYWDSNLKISRALLVHNYASIFFSLSLHSHSNKQNDSSKASRCVLYRYPWELFANLFQGSLTLYSEWKFVLQSNGLPVTVTVSVPGTCDVISYTTHTSLTTRPPLYQCVFISECVVRGVLCVVCACWVCVDTDPCHFWAPPKNDCLFLYLVACKR